MSYNGWANWETWNTVNWHGDAMQDLVNAASDQEEAEEAVEEFINALCDDVQGSIDGLLSDFLSEAVNNIQIGEIVATLWEDREDD